MDLALNNLQRLMCHKTQQTKPNHQVNQNSSYSSLSRSCSPHKESEKLDIIIATTPYILTEMRPCDVVVNELVCDTIVIEFELQSS